MDPRKYPPGTVIIPCGELSRYTSFGFSLQNLITPPGCQCTRQPGVNIANNINNAIRAIHGEWIWLLGDDHEFGPDCLLRLLEHDVDMVAPLVYKRQIPPGTVAYRIDPETQSVTNVPLTDLPESGLLPIDQVGGAGLLVKRKVFEAMQQPWFEYGCTQRDMTGEDLWFTEKARMLGFKLYLDVDTVMGHTTPVTIWPKRINGRWAAEVALFSGGRIDVVEATDSADH